MFKLSPEYREVVYQELKSRGLGRVVNAENISRN